MAQSVAVWLIFFGFFYQEGSKFKKRVEGKIALQQRARTEIKNGLKKPQSYPYVLQPTWNGRVVHNETLREAIEREAKEELGNEFVQRFNFSNLIEFTLTEYFYKGEKMTTHNFIGMKDIGNIWNDGWSDEEVERMSRIKLHSGALKLIFVSSRDFLKVYPFSSKLDPRTNLVMFDDQYKILKQLFSLRVLFKNFVS